MTINIKANSRTYSHPGINCLKRTGLTFAASLLLVVALHASHAYAQDAATEQPQGELSDSPAEPAAPEIPMDAPEPEGSNAASEQQNAEDELTQVRANKTLHRYSVGSIQKQRMLAEVRKKAIKQGLSGQRLERHMRGAKMVVGSVGANSMSLELKEGGKLLQMATPSEIYNRPATAFVAEFVGAPPMNMIEATMDAEGLRLDGSGERLALSGSTGAPRRVILGLRPEDVHLANPSDDHVIEATVDFAELTGPDIIVFARHGGNPLVASLAPHSRIEPDTRVRFSFAQRNMHIFDRETGRRITP
ncbi:MAG TPA: TOBE domain-containing protein [Turneriella sp.]|nr:TOBE domain-containing protein [Turneriella sp.]